MKRRIFAFLMAMIMLVSAFPAQVLATESAESEMYFIDDTVWVPEGEEPTAAVVETGEWVMTEETRTEIKLVCSETEHTHHYNCEADAEGNYSCGLTEHAHVTDGCASDCAVAEHTHLTDGCASDCVIAEHTHGDACSQQTTLVKWTVALKEDSFADFAEKRLPIHFFVSTLEEAQDPNGDYENYKQSSWGTNNGTAGAYAVPDVLEGASGSQIATTNGIRAHMVESDIIRYVDQWPDNGTADDFKKFSGSINVGGKNYSGDEYEVQWVTICLRGSNGLRCWCNKNYEHIHIDGILTKKIQIVPGTMNLIKEIETAQSEDQTFNFTLYQLQLDNNYKPTNQTIGSGTPMTATVSAGRTTASITPVNSGETFGFGYYMLVEEPGDKWMQSGIKIGNTSSSGANPIYICINTDGTVQYSTSYNSGYKTADSATVTNKLIPETQIQVTKTWNDDSNRDGIRPENVEVHLLKNNEHYGTPATLSAANNWTATWTVPATDSYGKEIAYNVEEVVPDGYTYDVTGDAKNGFVVTNTHTPEKTNVAVLKKWEDDNNRDGVRPHGVKVQLYCNGEAMGDAVTLTEAGSWTHEWQGLVKNGNVYTAKEVGYVDAEGNEVTNPGYTAEEGKDNHTGTLLITNKRASATMDIPVQKVWNDNSNQDGIRPTSVTVTLYANGEPVDGKTLTLNESNSWKGTFKDAYVNAGGKPVTYSVVENEVAGYTVSLSGNSADGFVVTNTHTPEKTDVPVTKVWDDANDQDGKRPKSIEVQLYADGVAVDGKTLTLDAAGNWQGAFTGLDKYKAGAPIEYTAKETAVPEGYDVSYNGTTITNTHVPETVKLNVVKVWNDANNQDGVRPEAVEITLYANGQPTDNTLKLNDANGWKGAWENMPRYHNGQRISYTTVETGCYVNGELVSGKAEVYTVEHAYSKISDNESKATVTNTYAPEKTSINVQKVWNDDDNRDGLRPAEVYVKLMRSVEKDAQGENIWEDVAGKVATLSPSNEWDCDFVDLPKYKDGQKIQYTVVETGLEGTGYEPTYSEIDANGVITVTNTRAAEKISVTVTKAWNDADNQDGKRPQEVTVSLRANGYKLTEDGTTVTLDANNNWSHTWENLYKNYHGETIVYTVVEAPVEGYTAGYLATADEVNNIIDVTVVNTHEPELTDIPVTKVWEDNHDQDGIRPDWLKVTLYADGKATDKTLTLDAAGNWQGTFTELPKYKDGTEIKYSVKETTEVNGYTASYNGTVITNTHTPAVVTVKATKVWVDDNNRDGKRPDSITVHLLKNGEHTGDYKELTTDTGWACNWENLPEFESGREIVYTVYEELPADAGYIASYTYDDEDWNNITITNTYKPETTEVVVLKVWNDDGNRDGLRPESIEVELYADGKATGKKLTLDETNNWNAQWIELKFRDGGTPIVYTVKEVNVPLGYTAVVAKDDVITNGMYIVTNTHESATTDVIVNKIWADENNNDGKRPDGIIVQLYANGSAVEGARVVLSEDNRWTHIWNSVNEQPLYIFDKGEEINYYVDEVGYVIDGEEFEKLPEGYTKTLSTADYTTDITNTRETEKLKLSVKKVWQDSDNNDGIRPEKVTVTLFAGQTEVEKAELSEANQWTHTWTGLYKYLAGEEVVYTIRETAVDGYEAFYTTEVGADGTVNWTVTNTHRMETKDVTVSKVWKDNNDAEGYRPDYVNVRLYKNGTAYGDVITLSGSNKWKYTTTLPVYEEGKQIVWTVVETKIPKYYSASYNQQTLTVTNTIQSKDIPKTGDASNLLFWMGTMLLSCAGAAALLFDKKRRSGS